MHSPSRPPRVSLSPGSPVGELLDPCHPPGEPDSEWNRGDGRWPLRLQAPPPPALWQLCLLGSLGRVLREFWQLACEQPLVPRSFRAQNFLEAGAVRWCGQSLLFKPGLSALLSPGNHFSAFLGFQGPRKTPAFAKKRPPSFQILPCPRRLTSRH